MVYYNGNVHRDNITAFFHDACMPSHLFRVLDCTGHHRHDDGDRPCRQQVSPWNWSPMWGYTEDRWTSPECELCHVPVDVPVHWRDGECWTWAQFNDGNGAIEALFAVTYAPYGDEDTCWSLADPNTPQTPENLARAAQAFHDTYDPAPAGTPDTETGRRAVAALRTRRHVILERPARIAATPEERARITRDVERCEMSEADRLAFDKITVIVASV